MWEKFKAKSTFRQWFYLATYVIVFAAIMFNFQTFLSKVWQLLSVLQPFFYGVAIAFILNIPMSFIERQFKKRLHAKNFFNMHSRGISIGLTLLFAVLVVTGLFFVIIPKLVETIVTVINNLSGLIDSVLKNADQLLAALGFNFKLSTLGNLSSLATLPWTDILANVIKVLGDTTGGITTVLASFGGTVMWLFVGFIISIYLLGSKEKYIVQFRKVFTVLLGFERARKLFDVGALSNTIFKGFITGQLLEAILLSGIYYVLLFAFGFPFPELVAAIIFLSYLVPIIGPTIGTVVGALLFFAVSPLYALGFIAIWAVISQLDGNFIYPHIVGSKVGLPGIWVLLSIFVFGALFGLLGMVIGVPITAVTYTLLGTYTSKKLKEHALLVTEKNVYKIEEPKTTPLES